MPEIEHVKHHSNDYLEIDMDDSILVKVLQPFNNFSEKAGGFQLSQHKVIG